MIVAERQNGRRARGAGRVAARRRAGRRAGRRGVTLVELAVVLICLAIAAAIVVPAASDGATDQLRAAAGLLVADLEYAQSESIGHADDPRCVVFDTVLNRYHVAARSAPGAALTEPVSRAPYVTSYGTGRAATLPRVRITGYALGGDNRLGFGGVGALDQTTPATVTLGAGGRSVMVTLDPVTGEAWVGPVQ